MSLFDRNYLLRISDLDDDNNIIQFEVRPPFNVDFNCGRRISGSSLDIIIYGLGEKKRLLLSKRNYEFAQSLVVENGILQSNPIDGLKKVSAERGGKELIVELLVGYGDDSNLRQIYIGEILQVKNSLSSVGFETYIECISDLSARNKYYSTRTITNKVDAIEKLMKDAGLEVGTIAPVGNEYIRPKVISGRPLEILKKMANITEIFYTDNGKGYFVPSEGYIEQSIRIIPVQASTGLLNTPSRQSQIVTFKCMINPNFALRSIIRLKSFVDPTVDGYYEIFDMIYVGNYEGESWVVDIQAQERKKREGEIWIE